MKSNYNQAEQENAEEQTQTPYKDLSETKKKKEIHVRNKSHAMSKTGIKSHRKLLEKSST